MQDLQDLPGLTDRLRLDKWLWAARFYKTRGLAADDIGKGRVLVNGTTSKSGRELKPGDVVMITQGHVKRAVVVVALSTIRGPAPQAQRLYQETPESMTQRLAQQEARRLAAEPAESIAQGRPTKKDRRTLGEWQRWSASLD